nr:MAG TPA: hypothetical protein [Caudoviricetes sp.]
MKCTDVPEELRISISALNVDSIGMERRRNV